VAGSEDGESGRPIVWVLGAGTATKHSVAAVRISSPLKKWLGPPAGTIHWV